jgi:hypothetical protein
MAMGHGLARRGSARPKVIPSKFREEGRSQGNYAYPSEVNSFLGKNKTSTKHAFARDCFHNEELDSCLQVIHPLPVLLVLLANIGVCCCIPWLIVGIFFEWCVLSHCWDFFSSVQFCWGGRC